MFHKLWLPAVALAGTLSVSFVPVSFVPGANDGDDSMFYGPGAVIDTVQAFLQALDKDDAKMLDLLVGDPSPRDGYVVVPDNSAKGGLRELKDDNAQRFFEVSHDGRPVAVRDKKRFLELLRGQVTCAKVKARTLQTVVRTIRADCPSQWCSYAVVQFERTYSLDGQSQKPIPMQATALVRYVKRQDASVPHFEIFHWHASKQPPSQQAPAKKGL